MNKLDEIIDLLKANKGVAMKRDEKKPHVLAWVLGILAIVAVIGGALYALYRYLKPCYLDDFDDDFEDDFDDDFFEDEEDIPVPVPSEEPADECKDKEAKEETEKKEED